MSFSLGPAVTRDTWQRGRLEGDRWERGLKQVGNTSVHGPGLRAVGGGGEL